MIRVYHHPADDLTSLKQVLALFPSNMVQYAATVESALVVDERVTPGYCIAVIDGDCKLEP